MRGCFTCRTYEVIVIRLLLISSGGPSTELKEKERAFTHLFDDKYARRLVRHLRDDPTLCTGCGSRCRNCRSGYKLDFSKNLIELKLPSRLLEFIDKPATYLPCSLEPHDVLVALNIHEDILLALPGAAEVAGCRAIIVPQEDPTWLDPWVKGELKSRCLDRGIEFASPKPFCALEESADHPFISAFIQTFRMGKPKLKVKVEGELVKGARVLVSAPCGNTYYVAYNLRGAPIDTRLEKVAGKYCHSYPCVASMKMDKELGDTILHRSSDIHQAAVRQAVAEALAAKLGSLV